MDRARIHEGIRRMRFEDIMGRSERSELSQMEAAELLGISERTFRSWRDRHREFGLAGLDAVVHITRFTNRCRSSNHSRVKEFKPLG